LIGVLWLGEKAGGGPYTQEEIEIARATGERLIDTRASAELARRLMALQRERLAESRLLDRRAHRLIHDEVLPELHAALLKLDGGAGEAAQLLSSAHRRLASLLQVMPAQPVSVVTRAGLLPALRALVAEEFAGAFDAVEWVTEAEAEQAAARLPGVAAEVLFYAAREAVRNAARYGRRPEDSAPLRLRVEIRQVGALQVVITDDGAGITPGRLSPYPPERPALGAERRGSEWGAEPAANGESAREAGGHGLALHQALLAVLGGTLAVESEPGRFTRVWLRLPLTAPPWPEQPPRQPAL
jgi:signal transduction histidine kinase